MWSEVTIDNRVKEYVNDNYIVQVLYVNNTTKTPYGYNLLEKDTNQIIGNSCTLHIKELGADFKYGFESLEDINDYLEDLIN